MTKQTPKKYVYLLQWYNDDIGAPQTIGAFERIRTNNIKKQCEKSFQGTAKDFGIIDHTVNFEIISPLGHSLGTYELHLKEVELQS